MVKVKGAPGFKEPKHSHSFYLWSLSVASESVIPQIHWGGLVAARGLVVPRSHRLN